MLTDGTWYNDPTLLTSLSPVRLSPFSHPLVGSFARSRRCLSSALVCLAYTLRFGYQLPELPLGRNPNSVAKRLRRIAPTPHLHFVCSRTRNILRGVFYQRRERERRTPEALCLVFRDDLPRFGYGKRCFKLLRAFDLLVWNLCFNKREFYSARGWLNEYQLFLAFNNGLL